MRVDRASLYGISSSAKLLINRRALWRKQFGAAHEVGPGVAVEADAMPGAVRQARDLIIRAEAHVSDHFARRGQSGVSGFALKIPYLALAVGLSNTDVRVMSD
jgi:hypothetical protein